MKQESEINDDTGVLLAFCQQHWEESRHTETQRATITNFIILVASAVFAIILQKGLSKVSIPLDCWCFWGR